MLHESLFSQFRLMQYHEGPLTTLPDKTAVGDTVILYDWDVQPREG